MSVLSDKFILEKIKEGNIIIDPFVHDNLCTSSYDVTLGKYYFREQKPRNKLVYEIDNIYQNDNILISCKPEIYNIYNMYDKQSTERVWGDIKEATPLKNLNIVNNLLNIDENDLVILIDPGETILCHTQEFIGGKNNVTTMMKCRSSFGRNFIEICKCSGWGDIGYINRWTMEITNNSRHYTIPLVVGRRCAQIIFFETGETLQTSYEKDGKYQSKDNIEDVKAMWSPLDMLPKMYKDREINN